MNSVKETVLKNRTYCFLNDMINTKNIDPNKIKIDEKPLYIITNQING